jgi:hypothetical protein
MHRQRKCSLCDGLCRSNADLRRKGIAKLARAAAQVGLQYGDC